MSDRGSDKDQDEEELNRKPAAKTGRNVKAAPKPPPTRDPDADWKDQLRSEISNLPTPVRRPPPVAAAAAAAAAPQYDDQGRALKGATAPTVDSRGRPSKNRVNTNVDGRVGAHALPGPAPRRNQLPPGAVRSTPPSAAQDTVVVESAPTNHNNVTNMELTTRATLKKPWWKSEPFLVAVGSMILVIIAVAVIVPMVLKMGDGNDNPSGVASSSSPSNSRPGKNDTKGLVPIDLTTLAPNLSQATIQAIQSGDGPEFQGAEWIATDPDWDTYEDWRKQQRFFMAIMVFAFKAIAVDNNFKFLDQTSIKTHECEWDKETDLCPRGDGVIRVLGDIRFTADWYTQPGYFPPELGLLSNLEEIKFGAKGFDQPLEEIFTPEVALKLSHLKLLKLHRCELQGPIPSSLGLFTQLTELDLGKNQLTSTIPSELGLLSILTSLILSENNLSGTIPEEIKNLPNLATLDVDKNSLLIT